MITDSLNKSLYYTAYYFKMIDREGILKRFIFNNNGTIIATNLLNLGIDALSINTILYTRALRLLKNYI